MLSRLIYLAALWAARAEQVPAPSPSLRGVARTAPVEAVGENVGGRGGARARAGSQFVAWGAARAGLGWQPSWTLTRSTWTAAPPSSPHRCARASFLPPLAFSPFPPPPAQVSFFKLQQAANEKVMELPSSKEEYEAFVRESMLLREAHAETLAAIQLGLTLVGPKLGSMVQRVQELGAEPGAGHQRPAPAPCSSRRSRSAAPGSRVVGRRSEPSWRCRASRARGHRGARVAPLEGQQAEACADTSTCHAGE